MTRLKRLCYFILTGIIQSFTTIVVDGWYGGFWQFRNSLRGGYLRFFYWSYLKSFGCFIGLNTKFHTPPVLPHGLNGIHISDHAVIGKKCVIFQQVTIGSNTLKGHPRYGSPTIGDRVLIGAGAKIIGKVTIGNNCRIGANCVVASDIPDNCTVVSSGNRIIQKENNDNTFIGIND